MDEFGVLTERYGLKPQGKSAPMSASKLNVSSSSSSSASNPSWGFPSNPNHAPSFDDSFAFVQSSGGGSGTSSFGNNVQSSVNLDDFRDVFGGGMYNSTTKSSSNGQKDGGFDYDDLFGSGSGRGSGSGAHVDGDDIFGGISELTSSSGHKSNVAAVDDDDIFGGFTSKASDRQNDILHSFVPPPPRQSSQVDDLLGGLGSGNSSGFFSSNKVGSSKMSGNNVGFGDDLIPGFGGSHSTSTGSSAKRQPEQLDSEDPFVILESTSKPVRTSADPLDEFDQFTEFKSAKHEAPNANGPKVSPIDELEEFAKGKPQKNVGSPDILFGGKKAMSGAKAMGNKQGTGAMSSNKEKAGDDLESFYMKSRASSAPKSRPKDVVNSQDIPKKPQKPAHGVSASMKKASSATNMFGDLSEIFGGNASTRDFEEVEGETEERRMARLRRHERTQERVGKAVAEMNQRDSHTRQEQEERHRVAEKIDLEIKQWVAGKEGNLRALLSSLQNVLWRECGWEAVSLTDLITSTAVKKVHRKAALCVHPDKVQQKGATVEQKYTAEKVFDILQEAWKKFEAEELR